ncbi:MAG: MFS transporter [Verrucomicrobiota bacterium]
MNKKVNMQCSTRDMMNYASGEIAGSLIMNTLFGFAMLFYTDALGLSPVLAGIAMSVAIFWDAITDPLMGHISDNTRSRFGRRHQYILLGGLLMVLSFLFVWTVPPVFRSSNTSLFWYLVGINMLLRTAFTMFAVPTTALGFEMCKDYDGRAKIQGLRTIFGMVANLCGPGLAWALFFPTQGVDTKNPQNYFEMATAFSIIAVLSIVYLVFTTRKYAVDSRNMKIAGSSPVAFFKDLLDIVTDYRAICVFLFAIVVILGTGLVATLQMYVYEHFMLLDGIQKTIAHGGTMAGMVAGAALCSRFTKRFDKKGAVYAGATIGLVSALAIAALFLLKILVPGQTLGIAGFDFPVAMAIFALLGAFYYFGNGIMLPVAVSMMADISEVNELKTGINKDGSYSAMFSLSMKVAQSISALVVGFALATIGFLTLGDLLESGNYAAGRIKGGEADLKIAIVAHNETADDAAWGFVKGNGNIESNDMLQGFIQDAGTIPANEAVLGYLTTENIIPGTEAPAGFAESPVKAPENSSVTGYMKGAYITQTPETVLKLFIATYIIGPIISITALFLIWLYPINKEYIEKLRAGAE